MTKLLYCYKMIIGNLLFCTNWRNTLPFDLHRSHLDRYLLYHLCQYLLVQDQVSEDSYLFRLEFRHCRYQDHIHHQFYHCRYLTDWSQDRLYNYQLDHLFHHGPHHHCCHKHFQTHPHHYQLIKNLKENHIFIQPCPLFFVFYYTKYKN